MKRVICLMPIICLALLWGAAPAGAAFGLKDLDLTFVDAEGGSLTHAGAHPFALKVNLAANTKPEPAQPELGEVPDEEIKDLVVTNVTGLAGNPSATPHCSSLDFLDIHQSETACSPSSRVGSVRVTIGDPHTTFNVPVFNLDPPPGAVLKLGFAVSEVTVAIQVRIKPTPPYNPIATVSNISDAVLFYASHLTLWGVPADHIHDKERGGPANVAPKPFLTLPRACEGPLSTVFKASSWEGSNFEETILTHSDSEPPSPLGFTDCARLGFAPRAAVKLSSDHTESPTGLDFEMDIEDEGLTNPEGTADSDIKKATVILPEGITLNPSVAEGLTTCSKANYEAESLVSEPGEGCPGASKVGTVEVETPLLEDQLLKGDIFVAQQDDPMTVLHGAENPFDSLIALYMVIKDSQLGILVKLAGKVSPNPITGQIETTFGEPGQELPQFPLGHVRVHLREGGRSPLVSPPSCSTYTTKTIFTPWADPSRPLESTSTFDINRGVDGGSCPPGGPLPFAPGFSAGTLNNEAKSYSPFILRLTRRDGDQDLTRFSFKLPPGLVGKLAGISRCSDAEIAAARVKTGRQELAAPSCPARTEIGHVVGGAGVGSQLTYVPGRLYLAGPFGGDPLSAVAIIPAVAGPFDVGTVVVRVALRLNSSTAAVEVDSTHSEPIPHILAGIPLRVRDVRVFADRPDFILNPTNCSPFAVEANLWGGGSDVFSPLDDFPVAREDRFQAANCARLGFRPKLALSLRGGTRRGDHPSLKAVVTTRPKDANFSRAVVTLPRSAFLDQGHIRTICTRMQYAAEACPPAAVYGYAKAWTPLLDEPAQGFVYLRSSNHNLPDLVMALKGPPSAAVDVDIVGRIDSHRGGIRSSFETIPDLPVSKFILTMQGGKKGLIVNSRNLCASNSFSLAHFAGQNGKPDTSRPRVRAMNCRKQHKP